MSLCCFHWRQSQMLHLTSKPITLFGVIPGCCICLTLGFSDLKHLLAGWLQLSVLFWIINHCSVSQQFFSCILHVFFFMDTYQKYVCLFFVLFSQQHIIILVKFCSLTFDRKQWKWVNLLPVHVRHEVSMQMRWRKYRGERYGWVREIKQRRVAVNESRAQEKWRCQWSNTYLFHWLHALCAKASQQQHDKVSL